MKIAVKKSLLAIAISGFLASPAVNATNGYFSHGYSTKEKGLAGAGTAFSQDAMAGATNPAGMAFVGGRMDIGLALFSPSPRGYKVTGTPPGSVAPPNGVAGLPVAGPGGCLAPFDATPGVCQAPFSVGAGSVDSENDIFPIPHFAYNWQLGGDQTIGISVYGNGGMNTEYKGSKSSAILPDGSPAGQASGSPITQFPGTFGAGKTGVNLEQLFFNISFAKKMNAKHAFGVSVILAAQRFSAQGLENFGGFSLDSSNLSGDRTDTAFGAGLKVGYQGEVAKGIRVGASYQSKVIMEEFDKYQGLFAEGGDFDVPSTYNIGASFEVGSSGVIVADIQRINYSDVAAISNSVSQLTNGACLDALNNSLNGGPASAAGAGCLGGPAGAGFGWDDMTIYKIGYQFDVGNNTYRIGYSHANQVIPKSQTLFNILAPAVIQDHITAGATFRIGSNQELNIAAMYAPKDSVKGANPFDGGATQIEIEMTQYELQAGWAWKY